MTLMRRGRVTNVQLTRGTILLGVRSLSWVVPWNGYVNRLQAWASADFLAQRLSVKLHVCWEPETVSPTELQNLFAASVLADTFVTADDFVNRFGADHSEFPRYLSTDPERNLIVLAGHDRGEQAFMGELTARIAASTGDVQMIIIAGGHFHGTSNTSPVLHRNQFYTHMQWAPAVKSLVDGVTHPHMFLGAHIRGTDRSLTAPRPRQITEALSRVAEREGTRSIFVAADSPEVRDEWRTRLQRIGLEPWGLTDIDHDL